MFFKNIITTEFLLTFYFLTFIVNPVKNELTFSPYSLINPWNIHSLGKNIYKITTPFSSQENIVSSSSAPDRNYQLFFLSDTKNIPHYNQDQEWISLFSFSKTIDKTSHYIFLHLPSNVSLSIPKNTGFILLTTPEERLNIFRSNVPDVYHLFYREAYSRKILILTYNIKTGNIFNYFQSFIKNENITFYNISLADPNKTAITRQGSYIHLEARFCDNAPIPVLVNTHTLEVIFLGDKSSTSLGVCLLDSQEFIRTNNTGDPFIGIVEDYRNKNFENGSCFLENSPHLLKVHFLSVFSDKDKKFDTLYDLNSKISQFKGKNDSVYFLCLNLNLEDIENQNDFYLREYNCSTKVIFDYPLKQEEKINPEFLASLEEFVIGQPYASQEINCFDNNKLDFMEQIKLKLSYVLSSEQSEDHCTFLIDSSFSELFSKIVLDPCFSNSNHFSFQFSRKNKFLDFFYIPSFFSSSLKSNEQNNFNASTSSVTDLKSFQKHLVSYFLDQINGLGSTLWDDENFENLKNNFEDILHPQCIKYLFQTKTSLEELLLLDEFIYRDHIYNSFPMKSIFLETFLKSSGKNFIQIENLFNRLKFLLNNEWEIGFYNSTIKTKAIFKELKF